MFAWSFKGPCAHVQTRQLTKFFLHPEKSILTQPCPRRDASAADSDMHDNATSAYDDEHDHYDDHDDYDDGGDMGAPDESAGEELSEVDVHTLLH